MFAFHLDESPVSSRDGGGHNTLQSGMTQSQNKISYLGGIIVI